MRHDDLLREIRDSIRANTAATQELQTYLTLMNNPVMFVEAGKLNSPMVAYEPGQAIRVDEPNGPAPGQLDSDPHQPRQMLFPFMRDAIPDESMPIPNMTVNTSTDLDGAQAASIRAIHDFPDTHSP